MPSYVWYIQWSIGVPKKKICQIMPILYYFCTIIEITTRNLDSPMRFVSKYVSLSFSLIFTILFAFSVNAQIEDFDGGDSLVNPNGLVEMATIDTNAYINPFGKDYQMDFPNLNRVRYYSNPNKIKKIRKLMKNKKYDKLLPVLEEYVRLFGIDNFYKDTKMIWLLGQLQEKQGLLSEAKSTYRLAMNHHLNNIKQLRNEFDTLTAMDKDYYVDLDYYYDLIELRRKIDTLHVPRRVNVNMGKAVNSKAEDYGPYMNNDNNKLIFTSKRNYQGAKDEANEDLFYSVYDYGYWTEAKPMGYPINSKHNEGSATLSADGTTLYFSRCNCLRCDGDCDIFRCDLQADGNWGEVRNLGSRINSKYWDSHPTLSPSGDTLFFSSSRPGGFGGTDIYFSTKTADGDWGPAENMGPIINTKASEVSPYYHPKHDVLYFSSNASNRSVNYGGFDIYRTHMIFGKWREPKNLGPLINGEGDEYYFTIDRDSKKIYFAKSKKKDLKNLDLYSYDLPMDAHPLATTKLTGFIRDDETGNPYEGIVTVIDLDNSIEVTPKNIRPDGSYEFDLIDDNNYLMVIQGKDFFRIEKQFSLDGDTKMDFDIPRIRVNRFVFENIEFEPGKAEIKEEMEGDLKKLIDFMLDNPYFTMKISGHTDSQGDEDDNIKLSTDRAEAIKQYLMEFSFWEIGDERIIAEGHGSSKPLVEEETDKDREINRRVEFEILNAEPEPDF